MAICFSKPVSSNKKIRLLDHFTPQQFLEISVGMNGPCGNVNVISWGSAIEIGGPECVVDHVARHNYTEPIWLTLVGSSVGRLL